MRIPTSLFLVIAFLLPLRAWPGEDFIYLDAGRGEARIPVYAMENPQASATLVLLPGGDSGTGKIVDGKPGSGNFLVRSRQLFEDEGFNVLVVFRASDLRLLDYPERISQEHMVELGNVVDYARSTFGKPVWLVGTSRGTVSATAAAIALARGKISGLVLTSSVTNRKAGAIGAQDLDKIVVPTLVLHHKLDACPICVPAQAEAIVAKLKNAPARKFILVDGGSSPRGDPCEAMHWHGYVNFEAQTVKLIADWIRNPLS
ncbi:alpha/beta hydrolase [Herbaspirillum sp.]|uniref:alpha/beta hydrolase n=1 Tax=Herbaspirillum sp. TaxID=1890675 RepID=UPI0031E3A995